MRTAGLAASMRDGFGGDVDTDYGRSAGELACAIAGTASGIENAGAVCKTRGETIAGNVLVEEVVIDESGDDAFARELEVRQRLAPGR
jgi:hypothetical protein